MKIPLKQNFFKRSSQSWRITVIMLAATLFYYLPTLLKAIGLGGAAASLGSLHNLFGGFDFLAVVFFAPVIYAAYVANVKGAVVTSLLTMVVLYPYSASLQGLTLGLLQPAAFTLIMSAIGAVIAMLQKGDREQQQRLDELQCLYDIGKAAHKKNSLGQFSQATIRTITRTLKPESGIAVRITVRDETFASSGFQESEYRVIEKLNVAGDNLGTLEIYYPDSASYNRRHETLLKTLANRIAGAIHEIELEQNLENYYTQLEEEVEKRTRDLESAQEKLIRTERLAAVGELASGVGHELRNPLNVIRNCVYLINMTMEGNQDEETQKTLRLLDQQVDISNKIVTDLLDFTRIRPPSPAPVDLNSLVRDSLSWVMLPQEIEVVTELGEEAPQVSADAEQVGRVFANLISNAGQAMGKQGRLVISSGNNGKGAWVSFADNGSGISQENMQRIFEPLFTTKPKGIGLGLAISRRLVEQNKGQIDVKSKEGEGTTFTIKLPKVVGKGE